MDDSPDAKSVGSSSVVEISTTSAVLFIVVASCFLILLYKLMSAWFIELLVVLFCIGGVEVNFDTPKHIIISGVLGASSFHNRYAYFVSLMAFAHRDCKLVLLPYYPGILYLVKNYFFRSGK